MVREYKGAYSGEHGDGLVRSEWIEPVIGPRLARTLEEIKDLFDPRGLMNPGKIVRAPKMDDRMLFRFKPGYATEAVDMALDWSEWGGFAGAGEMCNNNGHCRKFDAGTMCPSYRATRDEKDLTRGRANTLRLALSGQLGADGLASGAVREALDLCVSCKGCKRECPTGVDMAKMKIEFLHQWHRRHPRSLRDRAVAWLPRYAPWAAKLAPLANAVGAMTKGLLGIAPQRSLPAWRGDAFDAPGCAAEAADVVLFVDTFNRWHEPENARAALAVLEAAGYRVHVARAAGRPLCCGRTFLATGMVEEAKREAQRMLDALAPFVARGLPIVGLEPSCLFGLRDEFRSMLPGEATERLAGQALLFEEFLAREADAGQLALPLVALPQRRALLHGHCHQKAFGAMGAVQRVLALVPGLEVKTVESSCCGMAGAFGFEASHYDVSMKMAEAALLPAVRAADADTLVVADGTSCRHQIADGAQREALHVARVLAAALPA
jgi:Fe-S oxidoreductase